MRVISDPASPPPSPPPPEPSDARRLGLVGEDLLVRSRIAPLAGAAGWRLLAVRSLADAWGCDLLLFDLNRELEARLELLTEVRAAVPQVPAICFGAHLEAGSWAEAARRLGAVRCVANSRLADVLRRYLAPGRR